MDARARKRLERRLAAASALLAALLLPGGAPAASQTVGTPCKSSPAIRCLTVSVPLDRSGRVPGKVALHVQALPPPTGTPKGVVFLIAGGPGQAAASLFDFSEPLIGTIYHAAFPGHTLVAYDVRGTGKSGALKCPFLRIQSHDARSGQIAGCAHALGARRDFYGTPDHARDLDAVRQALGADKVALAAVSYGTELAVEYAREFPTHVDRMLLDSVALLDRTDPLAAHVFAQMPATLRRHCAGDECKTATDFAADVAALARKLETRPLRGPVLQKDGGRRTVKLDKYGFVQLVLDSDLNPGLALELPAAVHAARYGNAAPILRLSYLDHVASRLQDVNSGVYLATVCRDGRFPWQADTPLVQRHRLLDAAVRALKARDLGGFGKWAAEFGDAYSCVAWPSPAGGSERSTAPYPDVPVLALSGSYDMRTPTDDARTLVGRFPHGKVLVVPRVGHSVLTNDFTGCALLSVRAWVEDGHVGTCPRRKPIFDAVPAFATVSSAKMAGPKQTLELASATLREAVATWMMTAALGSEKTTVAGLTSGTVATSIAGITLNDYGIAPGIRLTGRLSLSLAPPPHFSGSVVVSGPNSSRGTVTVQGDNLRGVFGDTVVER